MKNIYAIGSKKEQRDAVAALGLPEGNYCNSHEENVKEFLDARTAYGGVSTFFECVGKNETVEQAVELTAAGGRICLVGNPYTDMTLKKETYWRILRRQLTIKGIWNSSYFGETDADAARDDWHYVLHCLQKQSIRPGRLITHRFALENLDKGFEIMRDKTENYIKIMGVF